MPSVKKRSDALIEHIRQEIANQPDDLITFARYMELVLYHPTLGYYCAPEIALGKAGDFTTAPEISSLFGQCLARQISAVMTTANLHDIYELGAGSGKLAFDILTTLHHSHQLPQHYFIYEISPMLREKQQAFLKTHCPQWFNRIHWINEMPDQYQGIVIANEVLDALPVHLFRTDEEGVSERCVTWKDGAFKWELSKDKSPELMKEALLLRDHYQLYSGYCSEINLSLNSFLKDIVGKLNHGVVLFIDYGYGQAEYYHQQRHEGTLTCFYQHQHNANPFLHPGLQDMTAHVDFTRVIEIASEYGCDLAGYTTQSAFLFACGLMDLAAQLESEATTIEQVALHHAIKILTMPTEMGDRIKVMALSKKLDISLLGFSLQDRRRDL